MAFGRVDQEEKRPRGLLFKPKEKRTAEARLKRAGETLQSQSRAERLGIRASLSRREETDGLAVHAERKGNSQGKAEACLGEKQAGDAPKEVDAVLKAARLKLSKKRE